MLTNNNHKASEKELKLKNSSQRGHITILEYSHNKAKPKKEKENKYKTKKPRETEYKQVFQKYPHMKTKKNQ